MEQSKRNKTGYGFPTWHSEYKSPDRDMPVGQWKYQQRSNITVPSSKSIRGGVGPSQKSEEYYSKCYELARSCDPSISLCPKHGILRGGEASSYHSSYLDKRPLHKKQFINNMAIVRRPRYENEFETDCNQSKYFDDDFEHYVDTNDDSNIENEDGDFHNPNDYSDYDTYADQDFEDRNYDESNEPVQCESSIDKNLPHKMKYQQYPELSSLPFESQDQCLKTRAIRSARRYQNPKESQEIFSEDESIRILTPGKPRSADSRQRTQHAWIRGKNSIDRCETSPQPRIRSVDKTESELPPLPTNGYGEKKCSCCGITTEAKSSLAKKNNCRFRDRDGYAASVLVGDDGERRKSYLNERYGFDSNFDSRRAIEKLSLYSEKPPHMRRHSVTYEAPKEGRVHASPEVDCAFNYRKQSRNNDYQQRPRRDCARSSIDY